MRNINTATEKQVPSENIYSEIGVEDVPSISSSQTVKQRQFIREKFYQKLNDSVITTK